MIMTFLLRVRIHLAAPLVNTFLSHLEVMGMGNLGSACCNAMYDARVPEYGSLWILNSRTYCTFAH
jgi:hypothetical protein